MWSTSSRSPERARAVTVALALVALVLAASCSAPSARTLPPPSSTSSTVPDQTTVPVDLSEVPLDTVAGVTTTTLRSTGSTTIGGVVAGPDGNLPGAVVHIERLVGGAVQPFEVRSAEDGTWSREALPGGRYRVRAFRSPDLAQLEPAIFYVADGDTRELRLDVVSFGGVDVQSGTTPDQPVVGDAVNLAVRVSERFVDERGVVRQRPSADVPVRVRSTGWSSLEEDETVGVTDGAGEVRFTFECDEVAPVSATAVVGPEREAFVLDTPDCSPRPTTTTATSTTDPTAADDEG